MMQWTSLEAYREILPHLKGMRLRTLEALLHYVNAQGRGPTGQELEAYAPQSLGAQPGRLKRLGELADHFNAVHRAGVRTCTITGRPVFVWMPGPGDGELGAPNPDNRLRRRLERLRQITLRLTFADARLILGCGEKSLARVWHRDDGNDFKQQEMFR